MATQPPEAPRPFFFLVGQDLHGRWLVQDTNGLIEGFFQSRGDALGFARSESDIHHVPVELSATPLTSHLLH